MDVPAESIYSSEWTSLSHHCCLAGGLDLPALLLHLKLSLVGFWRVWVATHHVSLISGDDLLRKFWEIEEGSENNTDLSPEERAAVSHFKENHRRTKDGRFVVPLPKTPDPPSLGESRSQAVRRFLSLERSLQLKNEFSTFNNMRQEYSDLCHAEPVPLTDLGKPEKDVFYLPIHAVKKESSTTTKIRAVFDASVKSSSGVSLNDLLVGPRYTLL